MNKIKKGDIVGRKSYGKDILFIVKRIIRTEKGEFALLKGLTERVEADSELDDLEIIEKNIVKEHLEKLNLKLEKRISKNRQYRKENKIGIFLENRKLSEKDITGRILHLDGDKKYSEKSCKYYKKMGLNAIVKNVPENRQPKVVYQLLKLYNPDILVITGHDGMIRKEGGYSDLYNYRNSRHFIETVKEARRYDKENNKNLVIFAGACQSFFEALISAGANFASSIARILIDFLDPLVVAEKIALTDKYKYVTIEDIEEGLRDGRKGVNGIGANGKMKHTVTKM